METALENAIFLDRDGVLTDDSGFITSEDQIRILPGVANALVMFALMQYKLIVVSNQPVVARGLIDENEVRRLHDIIVKRIEAESSVLLDDFFFCPHHPEAVIERYRMGCNCHKPAPGMLLEAAAKHNINLSKSYMIGDRITDCVAGKLAGCTTIQVLTGQHGTGTIKTYEIEGRPFEPDQICATLLDAAQWIGNR